MTERIQEEADEELRRSRADAGEAKEKSAIRLERWQKTLALQAEQSTAHADAAKKVVGELQGGGMASPC